MLTEAEVSAALEFAMEGMQANERARAEGSNKDIDPAANRLALGLAVELLESGRPLPQRLRSWLAGALRELHAALEPGSRPDGPRALNLALLWLGRSKRGRPPNRPSSIRRPARSVQGRLDESGLGMSEEAVAAALVLICEFQGDRRGARAKAVSVLASALHVDETTVKRATAEVSFPEDIDDRRAMLVSLAAPAISALRRLTVREPTKVPEKINDFLHSIGEP